LQGGSPISSGIGTHVLSRDDEGSRGDAASLLCVPSLAGALGIVDLRGEEVDDESDHGAGELLGQ